MGLRPLRPSNLIRVMPANEVRSMLSLPRIFCLVSHEDDLALLPSLAEAGVDGFQVRAKLLRPAELHALTRSVIGAVRPHGAVVVVNDHLDVALRAGADGVHLGANDLPVGEARRRAPGLLIGGTCRTRGEVVAAARAGADYAGFGPVFASSSKQGLPAPLGVEAVGAASGVLPLVAISGIDQRNAASVVGAGAYGVAVIGAIWRVADPVAAAKELAAVIG
jgi:thiamine-phosphate pyrophosphorylase